MATLLARDHLLPSLGSSSLTAPFLYCKEAGLPAQVALPMVLASGEFEQSSPTWNRENPGRDDSRLAFNTDLISGLKQQ